MTQFEELKLNHLRILWMVAHKQAQSYQEIENDYLTYFNVSRATFNTAVGELNKLEKKYNISYQTLITSAPSIVNKPAVNPAYEDFKKQAAKQRASEEAKNKPRKIEMKPMYPEEQIQKMAPLTADYQDSKKKAIMDMLLKTYDD